jgi:hypothetical protein
VAAAKTTCAPAGQLLALQMEVNGQSSIFTIDTGSNGGIDVFSEKAIGTQRTVVSILSTGCQILRNQPVLMTPRPRSTDGLEGMIGSGALRFYASILKEELSE